MILLSVVIPTWNRLETLKEVMQGFFMQTLSPKQFELIVVDSKSDDGTREYMESLRPEFAFRYIRQENRGRPGARNRGIIEARGDVVFFTDADIIPDKDLLKKHWLFHQTHMNSAAVGWESRIASLQELDLVCKEKLFRIHPPSRKNLSWLYFLTGNASVSKQVLLDAGLFDESFQGYGFEDLELGYRLERSGIKIYYLPEALNYHWHPRTIETQYETQQLAGRNAVRFYRKHGDWRIRWLLGMSPLAFFWHDILQRSPTLFKALKNFSLFRGMIIQYYYLLGVKDAWKKLPS